MNAVTHYAKQSGLKMALVRNIGVTLALLLSAQVASGASISGQTVDTDNSALTKVSICLALASSPSDCERVRWTDKKGGYTFSGLKPGIDYIVTVNGDSDASNRKFERHANYVWEPREHKAAINSKNEKLAVESFVGKFNFSNFQRIVSLKAKDFPELSSIDLAGSYVALKVFISSGKADEPPETIFLGRVIDGEKLKIRASVPLTSSSIEYEIFSANLSLSGSIGLAQ
ncbi:MAG: carboxypeptidase-like regulatory domain-containing protein [Halioglobus sp.]